MAGVSDGAFWRNPAEQNTQLSGDSMRRMLRVAAWHKRNGKEPPAVKHLVKWQHGTDRGKLKAEDGLQGAASYNLYFQNGYEVLDITYTTRNHVRMSSLFLQYKNEAIRDGILHQHEESSVRFTFDGDRLSGNETVDELGFVDGVNVIEVSSSSPHAAWC